MAENWWREVEQALGEALALPDTGRQSYLDQAGLAPEVRRRVEQLMAAWDDSAGFLESPALASAASPSVGMPPGTRLGSWRLVSVIGSGGMGTVYRAERADDQFTQEAAVKVVAGARVSRAMERRFREERQILARLEHANVARLMDGGVAPDGSPYLVMELVSGMPIDAWCREHGLDTRARLRLFRLVCEALQFAHQHLVVHCDLKPGNILVTEDGTPKLLDFGIARLMAHDPAATATLLHPMTLEYASPEQTRGTPLGTATDIYSLGVLLHELLTGRRPFELSGKPLDEVLDIVCHRQPSKPGTGSADLDAIVLKALRKEPAQRYASAGDLAADITRSLEGRPVQAHPPRAGYVLRKFVSRHRLAVAAAVGATALAFAAGIAILRESRIAARRFEDVRQLARFVIFDMNDAIEPLGGSTPARKMLVSHALVYLDGLARDAAGDEKLQLELAQAYIRIAGIAGDPAEANLGDSGEALRSYRKAVGLIDPLYRKHPRDLALGTTLGLAYQRMETVYHGLRQSDEALKAAEQSVAVHESMLRQAATVDTRGGLAAAYFARAHAVAGFGRPDRDQMALRDYIAATSIYEELLSKSPGGDARLRNAALGHKYVAGSLEYGKDNAQILFHLRRAEELDDQRVRANPSSREAKLDLSFDYSQDATFQVSRKDLPSALALFEKTLAMREELAASDPKDIRLRDRILFAELRIARILVQLKRPLESSARAQSAFQIARELYSHEPSPHYRTQLAMAYHASGNSADALGRHRLACDAWAEARRLHEENRRAGVNDASLTDGLAELARDLAKCK